MDGDERRAKIVELLKEEREPLSGTELAGKMGVSRQVIVQDIALLRAWNKNILSTNKGYILFEDQDGKTKHRRTFKVKHLNEEIQDELFTMVDYGGHVLDVVVEHDIYGQIAVDLIINSRADAQAFVQKTKINKTKPLNELTSGVHFHTVEAPSEEILNQIEKALFEKGYLIN